MDDKDQKLLIQMGLALRRLDSQREFEKITNLRKKIFIRYGRPGLHLAQFVQERLMITYITKIIDECETIEQIKTKVVRLIAQLETRVSFIQGGQGIDEVIGQINIRLVSNSPETYFIFCRGTVLQKGFEIKEYFENHQDTIGYSVELNKIEDRLIIILHTRSEGIWGLFVLS